MVPTMPGLATRLAPARPGGACLAATVGALLTFLGIGWPAVAAADARRGKCTVYVFLDARRQPVRTRHEAIVPPAQRHSLITYEDCAARLDEGQALSAAVEVGGTAMAGPAGGAAGRAGRQVTGAIQGWLLAFAAKIQGRLIWFGLLGLLSLASIIGLLVAAFRTSVLWGLLTLLGALFFPPLVIVFIALHWESAKVPFLAYVGCWLACVGLFVL
jgi:hypothetical protein